MVRVHVILPIVSKLRRYLLRAAHERQRLNTRRFNSKGYLALIDSMCRYFPAWPRPYHYYAHPKSPSGHTRVTYTESNKISDNAALALCF